MVKCAVPSCKNDSRKQNKKNGNISYHRFPKNRQTMDAWVKAIKRPNWEPNIRNFVCSIHFDSSFKSETKKGLRILNDDAVPELYLQANPNTLNAEVQSVLLSEKVIPSSEPASMSVLEKVVSSSNDIPQKLSLERKLKHVQEIAKRRRLRCNALYAERRRLKSKIASLTQMLTELRKMITQEHSDIFEMCEVVVHEDGS